MKMQDLLLLICDSYLRLGFPLPESVMWLYSQARLVPGLDYPRPGQCLGVITKSKQMPLEP